MTVQEFYDYCVARGIENYVITTYECSCHSELDERMIDIHENSQTVEIA